MSKKGHLPDSTNSNSEGLVGLPDRESLLGRVITGVERGIKTAVQIMEKADEASEGAISTNVESLSNGRLKFPAKGKNQPSIAAARKAISKLGVLTAFVANAPIKKELGLDLARYFAGQILYASQDVYDTSAEALAGGGERWNEARGEIGAKFSNVQTASRKVYSEDLGDGGEELALPELVLETQVKADALARIATEKLDLLTK